jgi:hypothetical protein
MSSRSQKALSRGDLLLYSQTRDTTRVIVVKTHSNLVWRKSMKRLLLAMTVTAGLFGGIMTTAHAAPHNGLPSATGCTISAGTVALGDAYTVRAAGLPTTAPVYLLVAPPGSASTVSEVYVSATGAWAGTEASSLAGTWTYTFSGLMPNNKYGTVASCSVQVG